MEFNEVILSRASVRRFTDEKVEVEDIKKMVTAASAAPSINNSQPWKFTAITNQNLIKKMSEAVLNKYETMFPDQGVVGPKNVKITVKKFASFFIEAPAVIAVSSTPYTAVIDDMLNNYQYNHDDINKIRNYPNYQTMGAAIENLILSAVDLGYGACWLTGPMVAKNELESLIGLKEPYTLTALVAVGKPKEKPQPREKKPLEEIFEIIE